MIFALIGHRGVGKTTLLERIESYYRDANRPVIALDLDQQIASRAHASIAEIFARQGEDHFRALEQSTLRELTNELVQRNDLADVYIAIGAGYRGDLPGELHVVWVRRITDALGRIFTGTARPRLSPRDSPRNEYLDRFAHRQSRYAQLHHDVWYLREGLDSRLPQGESPTQEAERAFVMSALATAPLAPDHSIGGAISLLPEDLRNPHFADWIARRLAWRDVRFELRDDLLNDEELARAMALIPVERRIFSVRRSRDAASLAQAASQEALWDFPLELAHAHDPASPPILSLHERREGESLHAAADRLQQAGARMSAQMLKLAIEVYDFAELLDGWRWAKDDPKHRAFLPRAAPNQAGRWRWFRVLTGRAAPLAFFREGEGTSLDQPLCGEWLQRAALSGTRENFAAVLGDPIDHSRTPVEHAAFFAQRGLPVLAIRISEAELRDGGLQALQKLGLRDAAVTAPLKMAVAAFLHARGELDPHVTTVNTLYFDEVAQRWHGENTDLVGARALLAPIVNEPQVAIWGGGGTLPVLREVLPQARCFSARTGDARDANLAESFSPTAIVWASGSAEQRAPDARWQPRAVYDLSYGDDSAGREYALRVSARYVSGLAMFFAQAAAQRDFFARAEAGSIDAGNAEKRS